MILTIVLRKSDKKPSEKTHPRKICKKLIFIRVENNIQKNQNFTFSFLKKILKMDVSQKDEFEEVSCECNDQSVECSKRSTIVKDMIEKFDVTKKESNGNILQPKKSLPEKSPSKKSVKTLSASFEKLPHIVSTKSFFKMENSKRSRKEKPKIALESDGLDLSYQSRTTISKTSQGVRIITDIFYDPSLTNVLDEGIGSRIETDIPPSKILQDFQQRYSSDLD